MASAEGGTPVKEVRRKFGVSDQSFYRWKREFAKLGIITAERVAMVKPLAAHVDDFEAALIARGNTKRHAIQTSNYVRAIIDGIGATFWGELTAAGVERYLANRRSAPEPDTRRRRPGRRLPLTSAHVHHHARVVGRTPEAIARAGPS